MNRVLRYSVFLAYPMAYYVWIKYIDRMWVENNIRHLHPEIHHPTQYRYEPNKLKELITYDRSTTKQSLRKRLERNLSRPIA